MFLLKDRYLDRFRKVTAYRLLCLGWNILTLSRTYLTTREHLSERVIILTSNTQVLISINRNVGYECKKKEFEDTKEVISTRILKMDSKYNFFVKRNVKQKALVHKTLKRNLIILCPVQVNWQAVLGPLVATVNVRNWFLTRVTHQ